MSGGGGNGEMDMLSVERSNRSPSLTPKGSLTPTNSHDSTASNSGRSSPNWSVASPSSGQEVPLQQLQQVGHACTYMYMYHTCVCVCVCV